MNRKILTVSLALLLASGSFCSCKDDDSPAKPNYNPTPTNNTKPADENGNTSEEPENYDDVVLGTGGLKTYLNHKKYPNFKVSGALDVGEFNTNKNGLRDIIKENFEEIVAGNAMKYSSCVNDKGEMNFTRVKQFVSDARGAGVSIFGHTLAWHSQQQPKYLNTLSGSELVSAMENWIKGSMEATAGYVKAWDVVNEPISGEDTDNDGVFELQSTKINNSDDATNVNNGVFYWQEHMGDLEYVRNAVKFARQYFQGNAEDLKLFINDYNLESDWDDNKKLKSLIAWIKKWEDDGVTKIDGIGTQMHICCFEDEGIQKNIEDHIVNMFKLMAATGKLVRVSELDMGYVRGNSRWNGTKLQTPDVTAAEHQRMADFYKFIVKKYLEIIPKDQQYGICQWCLTDAPATPSYVWRHGEPVGFWTEGFKEKKATWQGFADGLSEK